MNNFSNKAIKTAEQKTLALYQKLAETKPTEQWPLDEISSLMWYLKDYMDELNSLKSGRIKSLKKDYKKIQREMQNNHPFNPNTNERLEVELKQVRQQIWDLEEEVRA